MKNLIAILAVLFTCAQQPLFAVEKIDQPFQFFLKQANLTTDTAAWALQPTVAIPTILAYRSDDKSKILDVSAFDRIAAGLSYGRYIKTTTGTTYETVGVSALAMFSSAQDFSAGFTLDLFNRLICIGPGYDLGSRPDGHRVFLMMGFGIKIF